MTILSVNINKIATLRNARGEDYPNLLNMAIDIIKFGAQGITIHPRPDERHIRYEDAIDLKKNISCELNIEGNPIKKFVDLVNEVKPAQVTLVPDSEYAITSPSCVLNLCSSELSSPGLGELRLSTATVPAPSLNPASTASVSLCRFEGVNSNLSTL